MRTPLLERWGKDEHGGAVVELGFIAPLLVAVILGVITLGYQAYMVHDMRAAVSSAAQYVMGGSRNTSDIQQVALSAWNRRPAGGNVAVSLSCKCGSGAATCGAACSGAAQPTTYITILATATFTDSLMNRSESIQQVVRVR